MDPNKQHADSEVEIRPDSRPGYRLSRRNFIAVMSGGATFGAMLISNLSLSDVADAGPARRRRRRIRRRTWWGRRRRSGGNGGKATCFLKGTLIQTPHGEVAIEDLRSGDLVTTISGSGKPVKWVGRMTFEKSRDESWDRGVAPIKIAESAISEGLPSRDLYLSSAHHLYMNGLLIPASAVVNDQSIARCNSMETQVLEYYHIELESHDVVLANGLPAETLLSAQVAAFDNHEERYALYGDEPIDLMPYAPRAANDGIWENLNSRLRSIVSPIYDRRKTLDVIRDELADRAELRAAS
jgi:Hint domain